MFGILNQDRRLKAFSHKTQQRLHGRTRANA